MWHVIFLFEIFADFGRKYHKKENIDVNNCSFLWVHSHQKHHFCSAKQKGLTSDSWWKGCGVSENCHSRSMLCFRSVQFNVPDLVLMLVTEECSGCMTNQPGNNYRVDIGKEFGPKVKEKLEQRLAQNNNGANNRPAAMQPKQHSRKNNEPQFTNQGMDFEKESKTTAGFCCCSLIASELVLYMFQTKEWAVYCKGFTNDQCVSEWHR